MEELDNPQKNPSGKENPEADQLPVAVPAGSIGFLDNRRASVTTVTVSQALERYGDALKPPAYYLSNARRFLLWCLEQARTPDDWSLEKYREGGLAPSVVSSVRKFIRFYETSGISGIRPDPERPTVPPVANELILGYLRDAANLNGDESQRKYVSNLNQFFVWVDAEVAAGNYAAFDDLSVRRHLKVLWARKYSPFTVNLRLTCLKQLAAWCLTQAARLQLSAEAVESLQKIQKLKRQRLNTRTYHKDSLTLPQRTQLMQQTKASFGPETVAMIALMAYAGLRTVEVVRLQVRDVDFEEQRLWVQGKGKKNKESTVLPQPVADKLRDYLQSSGPADPEEALFPGLTTRKIRHLVADVLAVAGLKKAKLSAHSLRHTAAQVLIDQGVLPDDIQLFMRHAQYSTTQVYLMKKRQQQYAEHIHQAIREE